MLMKVTIRAILLTLTCTLSIAAYARADAPKHVDIPAGDLSQALLRLSKQYGADLVYRPEQVYGLKTHGAHGELTTEQAVTQLLQGTPLELRTDSSGAMLIAPPIAETAQGAGTPQASNVAHDASDDSKEGKKSSSGDFRVAQVDQGTNSQSSAVDHNTSTTEDSLKKTQLTEIIVTAQKRSERLQDVPVPVSVISADTLVENNKTLLRDFYTSIPGLSDAPALRSDQVLSIRGLAIGVGTNPTVGITVDDVPYGGSTNLGGGTLVPEIDPGDLARVEVLRGPQGTLYGASSIGGLIKFVTLDPSTDGLSGRVQAGLSGVQNGAELGYNVRASVNVPLSDTLAIRASGFTREDPGYIDNPVLHIDGINKTVVYGGHLSTLWKPSDVFSVKLSALYQRSKADGSSDVNLPTPGFPEAGLGDLQQNYLPGVGGYDRQVQAYSATVTAKLGSVDLTAISGYNVINESDSLDFTYAYAPYNQALFGVTGAPIFNEIKNDKFTQEIRLSSPTGQKFEWLFGGFYQYENFHLTENILAADATTGRDVGQFAYLNYPGTYMETAAFADVTYHFTDEFDIQIGGRESQNRQTSSSVTSGPIVPFFYDVPSPLLGSELDSKANAFTYLVTPRLKLSPDFMIYARLASGYRAGGPNAGVGVPREYNPDKTQNYELGVKSDFLDHRLSFDGSLYYIDWKDVQLSLVNPTTSAGYIGNAGGAKSQGVELSMESKPLTDLTVAAWVAFNDAELTKAIPPGAVGQAVGADGSRLPYSSRFSGNISIEEDFPLWGSANGFVGGMMSYVGDRTGEFIGANQQRQDLPAYTKTDLRTGAKYNSWTVNLFVNNVANRRGLLSGGPGNYPPFSYYYIQPRTVGLSFATAF